MKIRQIIVLGHWYDKKGLCQSETYEDKFIEVNQIPKNFDWSWWKKGKYSIWDDILICVTWISEDGVELYTWNIWESEI